MIAELAADYTNNGKWVELYKLFASTGQVIDAVDTVIQYTLLDQIDHEVFKEVLNFYIIDVIWRHSEMGLKSSDSKDALRRLSAAFPESWVPRHISQWFSIFNTIERTRENRVLSHAGTLPDAKSDFVIIPEDPCLRAIFDLLLVGFHAPRHIEVSRIEYLPMQFLVECAHLIQGLENEESSLAALRVVCGLYQIKKYGGPFIIHFRSGQLFCSNDIDNEDLETLMLPVINWAKQKLSEAVSLLDAHARDLIRVTLPQRCLFFLVRGNCKKAKTGECLRDHNPPTAEICGRKMASLLRLTEFYGRLTNFYYRNCMPESFQQPFTGRRRFWIQSLEREVIFVSALEHSPRDIRILQSELVENPTWKCAAACWEEFLFYRIDRDWLDIQTFTGILEQTHLAYLSGRGTMSVFGRTLMRKINCILSRHSYQGHPLIATKMALIAFEKIFRAAPNIRNKSAKLEMRSALSDFIRASDLARNIVMWNIYPVLNVIEVGITAFLCSMGPGNAVVLPTSWAYSYLPSIFVAPIALNAAEASVQDLSASIVLLTDILLCFCPIFEAMKNDISHSRPPQMQSKASRHTLTTTLGLPKRRVFDLLLTVMFNISHYPRETETMKKLWSQISKTMIAVAPLDWTTSVLQGPEKLREGARIISKYYQGKNNLRVVTLDDRSTAPKYFQPFVNRDTSILKVSECLGIGNRHMVEDFLSLPPVFVDSFQADEYSDVETNYVVVLQKRWKLVRKILEGRREMQETVEGRANITLHILCNELLLPEGSKRYGRHTLIAIRVRYVLFTRGHELLVRQENFAERIVRIRTKLKQLFNNKELPATDLERLDEIQKELFFLTREYETTSLNFVLESVSETTTILPSPIDLGQTIEGSLERMIKIDRAASKIQTTLDRDFMK